MRSFLYSGHINGCRGWLILRGALPRGSPKGAQPSRGKHKRLRTGNLVVTDLTHIPKLTTVLIEVRLKAQYIPWIHRQTVCVQVMYCVFWLSPIETAGLPWPDGFQPMKGGVALETTVSWLEGWPHCQFYTKCDNLKWEWSQTSSTYQITWLLHDCHMTHSFPAVIVGQDWEVQRADMTPACTLMWLKNDNAEKKKRNL